MLRITRVAGPDSTPTLKLEGKLIGPWVEELKQICTQSVNSNRNMRLDLSAVSFVDPGGLRLLHELLGGGVTLAACSGLVAELLRGDTY
jgi:ABC-type transporter Mla MlaB component